MDSQTLAALHSLQRAANQLSRAADNTRELDATADVYRLASRLVLRIKNAVESGAAFDTASQAQEFDHAVGVREAQLHVNPETSRY